MRADEVVDDRLVGRIDGFELDAHAHAAIAPGHAAFGVHVAFRAGYAEPHADLGTGVERAGGSNRETAVPEIQGECGRNRVAESILNRNPEDGPRTTATIEVVREQVGRE